MFLLENEFSNEELADMTQLISRCRQRKLGSNLTNGITQQFDARTHSKLSELSKKGRMTKLWMMYHTLVLKINNFILAERIHNHGCRRTSARIPRPAVLVLTGQNIAIDAFHSINLTPRNSFGNSLTVLTNCASSRLHLCTVQPLTQGVH